jgi:hypothetical protein
MNDKFEIELSKFLNGRDMHEITPSLMTALSWALLHQVDKATATRFVLTSLNMMYDDYPDKPLKH